MYQIAHYVTPDGGQDVYVEWLKGLKDTTAKIAVVRRVARIEPRNGSWTRPSGL